MPKKHQIVQGIVKDTVFPNQGILQTTDNEEVYVTGAFKGQKLSVQLQKKKKGHWIGRIMEVIENPDYFISPACSHFGSCGGCSMQHTPYEMQINMKYEQVKKLLQDAQVTGYEDMGIVKSPDIFAYRNKMEFSFGDAEKDGPLTLGMHKKNSRFDVITVSDCRIVSKDFTQILDAVLAYCQENKLSYYKKLSHEGLMRYMIIRKSQTNKDILVNIVTSSQQQIDFMPLIEKLLQLPLEGKITGVLHTLSDTLADAVKPDSVTTLYGTDTLKEELLGLSFEISPFSFFQTNTKGAEVLYTKALDMLEDINNKTIFDLYCGTGTITQIMATRAKKVYGIEIVEEAVEKAKANAALNHLDNCEFIAGDVLEQVDKLKEKPDIIILDPPRDGIHPKAIQKIINFGAKEMVYISCKPSSLARDLPIFKEQDYTVDKVMCVDMFPQTPHVETVVHLTRTNRTK